MEIIKEIKDKFEYIKTGKEEVLTYKSLNGKAYSTKEGCLEADNNFIEYQKRIEFINKYNKKEIYNNLFYYDLIFVKNYDEIEEYHNRIYGRDYIHRKWKHNDDIKNEWIALEHLDGGDSRDYVEYYRVLDLINCFDELINMIK